MEINSTIVAIVILAEAAMIGLYKLHHLKGGR